MEKTNKIRVEEINFEKLIDIERILDNKIIKDSKTCEKIEELVKDYKSYKRNGKEYYPFYLPIEDKLIPFFIFTQKNGFFIDFFGVASFWVEKGEDKNEEAKNLLNSIIDKIKEKQPKNKKEIEEKVVYWKGEIKRKYITRPEVSKKEAKEIMKKYKDFQKTEPKRDINLKDFLEVAANLIKKYYEDDEKISKEIQKLKPIEIYAKFADPRRVEPFNGLQNLNEKEIEELSKDKKLMEKAKEEDLKEGCHTFEILPRIYLWPKKREFILNFEPYDKEAIKLVMFLIEKKVPFKAPSLKNALKFLSGEEIIDIFKEEVKKEYQKYGKWEELPVPILKKAFIIRG
ncbi:MAG: hypothetical protein ACP5HJ_02855 [Candidatus Micrarchaeia archaeon]